MKDLSRILLAVALIAALAVPVMGAARSVTAPSMPGAIAADTTQVMVKVVGVNSVARTITLQMPNGKTMTYKVGKDVRSFGMVKKGDMIKATLLDALAVFIQKHGGKPMATETTTVVLSPRGAMPATIVANTIRITGKIQTVDMANRRVTVTGPSGMSKAFKVGSNVKNLAALRPGDDVVIRYTEALAMDLQKPKK